MSDIQNSQQEFIFYNSEDGTLKVQVIVDVVTETLWATQKAMSELFGVTPQNITIHLKNIFQSGELQEESVCKENLQTARDGKTYMTKFYNLDAIISVGYRVNSQRATRFRQWAGDPILNGIIKDGPDITH